MEVDGAAAEPEGAQPPPAPQQEEARQADATMGNAAGAETAPPAPAPAPAPAMDGVVEAAGPVVVEPAPAPVPMPGSGVGQGAVGASDTGEPAAPETAEEPAAPTAPPGAPAASSVEQPVAAPAVTAPPPAPTPAATDVAVEAAPVPEATAPVPAAPAPVEPPAPAIAAAEPAPAATEPPAPALAPAPASTVAGAAPAPAATDAVVEAVPAPAATASSQATEPAPAPAPTMADGAAGAPAPAPVEPTAPAPAATAPSPAPTAPAPGEPTAPPTAFEDAAAASDAAAEPAPTPADEAPAQEATTTTPGEAPADPPPLEGAAEGGDATAATPTAPTEMPPLESPNKTGGEVEGGEGEQSAPRVAIGALRAATEAESKGATEGNKEEGEFKPYKDEFGRLVTKKPAPASPPTGGRDAESDHANSDGNTGERGRRRRGPRTRRSNRGRSRSRSPPRGGDMADLYPPGSRLFLGNLATEKVSKTMLRDMFEKYGKVMEISSHKSFGFIQYTNPESAAAAKSGENKRVLAGLTLDISMATHKGGPRKGAPSGRRRGRFEDRRDNSPPRSSTTSSVGLQPCRDWVLGKCRRGYRCKFAHEVASAFDQPSSSQHNKRGAPDRSNALDSYSDKRARVDPPPQPTTEAAQPIKVPDCEILVLSPARAARDYADDVGLALAQATTLDVWPRFLTYRDRPTDIISMLTRDGVKYAVLIPEGVVQGAASLVVKLLQEPAQPEYSGLSSRDAVDLLRAHSAGRPLPPLGVRGGVGVGAGPPPFEERHAPRMAPRREADPRGVMTVPAPLPSSANGGGGYGLDPRTARAAPPPQQQQQQQQVRAQPWDAPPPGHPAQQLARGSMPPSNNNSTSRAWNDARPDWQAQGGGYAAAGRAQAPLPNYGGAVVEQQPTQGWGGRGPEPAAPAPAFYREPEPEPAPPQQQRQQQRQGRYFDDGMSPRYPGGQQQQHQQAAPPPQQAPQQYAPPAPAPTPAYRATDPRRRPAGAPQHQRQPHQHQQAGGYAVAQPPPSASAPAPAGGGAGTDMNSVAASMGSSGEALTSKIWSILRNSGVAAEPSAPAQQHHKEPAAEVYDPTNPLMQLGDEGGYGHTPRHQQQHQQQPQAYAQQQRPEYQSRPQQPPQSQGGYAYEAGGAMQAPPPQQQQGMHGMRQPDRYAQAPQRFPSGGGGVGVGVGVGGPGFDQQPQGQQGRGAQPWQGGRDDGYGQGALQPEGRGPVDPYQGGGAGGGGYGQPQADRYGQRPPEYAQHRRGPPPQQQPGGYY